MFKVEVGGIYTNPAEIFAREIVEIADGKILYNNYGYPDGKPIGLSSRCSVGHFSKWAARRLTPSEAEDFRKVSSPGKVEQEDQFLREILDRIPDELLIREALHRGLDLK